MNFILFYGQLIFRYIHTLTVAFYVFTNHYNVFVSKILSIYGILIGTLHFKLVLIAFYFHGLQVQYLHSYLSSLCNKTEYFVKRNMSLLSQKNRLSSEENGEKAEEN